MVQGSLIGVIGTAMGVVGGILLAQNIATVVPFLEGIFGFSLFPSDIYYITELPSDLRQFRCGLFCNDVAFYVLAFNPVSGVACIKNRACRGLAL